MVWAAGRVRGSDSDLGGQRLELQTPGLCVWKDGSAAGTGTIQMSQSNMGGHREGPRTPSGSVLLAAPAKRAPKRSRRYLSPGARGGRAGQRGTGRRLAHGAAPHLGLPSWVLTHRVGWNQVAKEKRTDVEWATVPPSRVTSTPLTPTPPHLPHEPRNPGALLGLLSLSLSSITHLGCCSRWSWCPPVEVGVDRGTGRGPGLRSFP